ncbi:MAG TPA: hypothetical protein VFE24_07055, partial [Pirellulales bacterium]|nr:hypothetical protein [Pirellulales bacterium]
AQIPKSVTYVMIGSLALKDDSIPYFLALPSLKTLDVAWTSFTARGVARLRDHGIDVMGAD